MGDIETLVLGILYPVVLLASNLIDAPEQIVRSKFLATCRRHVLEEGAVVLQRYRPRPRGMGTRRVGGPGSRCRSIARFERQGDHFSASIEYRRADRSWAHGFSAAILDDETLRAELAHAGLRLERILDPEGTWILATP